MNEDRNTSRQTQFTPLFHLITQSLSFNKIMYKYHDHSLIVKERAQKKWWKVQLNNIDQKWKVIQIGSTFYIIWNYIYMLCVLYNLYEIPVAVFFFSKSPQDQYNTSAGLAINFIIWSLMMVDWLIIRPSMEYDCKGYKLLTTREQILMQQFKLQFWLDGIGNIVLLVYLLINAPSFFFFKILFYLKIYTLFRINSSFLNILAVYPYRLAIYRLLTLLFMICLIALWVGSIFFAIDYHFYIQQNQYYQNGNLWLTNSIALTFGNLTTIDMIEYYPVWVWVNYSFYYAIQTMSTVGFGDVTPKNPVSVIYCTIIILITLFAFVTFVNEVQEIISQVNEGKRKRRDNLIVFKQLSQDFNIPPQLWNRMLTYLDEMWNYDENQSINNILDQILPKQLKNQFYINYKTKIFQGLTFIDQSINNPNYADFFLQLTSQLTQQRYAENQTIYSIGDRDSSLYYVFKGRIIITLHPTTYHRNLQIYQNFGMLQFITNQQRLQKAVSVGFSMLTIINRSAFITILKKYPNIYQNFCETLEQVVICKKGYHINLKCYQCGGSHSILNCNQIFLSSSVIISQIKQRNSHPKYQFNKSNVRCWVERPKIKGYKIINHKNNYYNQIDKYCKFENYRLQYDKLRSN